jgi:RimJ/RimL family protein N-acetyltransferase
MNGGNDAVTRRDPERREGSSTAGSLQPTIDTDRLVLRPFDLRDAARVQSLVSDRAIADTTLRIPHPYEDGMAEEWIGGHHEKFSNGTAAVFAVTVKPDGVFVGAIGLDVNAPDQKAELGYWIGVPYWNRGYATEAARAVLRYAFENLHLNRVFANHFTRNPASGRVLQNVGMRREGCQRQHVWKWDRFEDLENYGILRGDWAAANNR